MRFPVILAIVVDHGHHAAVLDALQIQRPIEADIFVIEQSPTVADICNRFEAMGATITRPGRNIGAGAAWNAGLLWAWERDYRAALVINDDIALSDPRTLTIFRDLYVCCGRQLRYAKDRGFSAIAIGRETWDAVGGFDEGYWPAYFEDNDYHRRCILAGIPYDDMQIDSIHLGGGSSTIKASPTLNRLNGTTFSCNRDRYIGKWGGSPGHERFATPWDGGAAWASTRDLVAPDVRDGIERIGQPQEVPA